MKTVVLDWSNLHRHGDLWWRLLSHRHDVFVKDLGWEIPTANRSDFATHGSSNPSSVEFDQYDGPMATYLVVLDDDGEIAASARLVRTDTSYKFGPYNVTYMIKDAVNGMLDNIPKNIVYNRCPDTADTWELTRYTSTGRKASVMLFDALNSFLVSMGATSVLTLSPPTFVRWLKAIKFSGEVVGPEIDIDGEAFAVVRTKVRYDAEVEMAPPFGAAKSQEPVHEAA